MPERKDDLTQIGRLALREEGNWWNAYWAAPDTMERAVLLGSVRMTVVRDPHAKQAFMDAMRAAMTVAIEETLGGTPVWPDEPDPAPEHERSGKA